MGIFSGWMITLIILGVSISFIMGVLAFIGLMLNIKSMNGKYVNLILMESVVVGSMLLVLIGFIMWSAYVIL